MSYIDAIRFLMLVERLAWFPELCIKGHLGFIAASIVLRHRFGYCVRLHQSNRRVVGQGVQVAEVDEEEPRPISHQSSFAMRRLAEGCMEVALEQLVVGPPCAPG